MAPLGADGKDGMWNSSDSTTVKLWIPRSCSFIWSKRRAHNSARALIQSKGNGREVWVTVWVTVWWGIWRYLLDIHHFTSFYVKKESFLNCKLQNLNVEDVQEMMQFFRHKGSAARLTIRCFSLSTAPPTGPLAGHMWHPKPGWLDFG